MRKINNVINIHKSSELLLPNSSLQEFVIAFHLSPELRGDWYLCNSFSMSSKQVLTKSMQIRMYL